MDISTIQKQERWPNYNWNYRFKNDVINCQFLISKNISFLFSIDFNQLCENSGNKVSTSSSNDFVILSILLIFPVLIIIRILAGYYLSLRIEGNSEDFAIKTLDQESDQQ